MAGARKGEEFGFKIGQPIGSFGQKNLARLQFAEATAIRLAICPMGLTAMIRQVSSLSSCRQGLGRRLVPRRPGETQNRRLPNRKVAIPRDAILYRQRHRIENMFGRLKDWRRVHTRYDRCARTHFSAIYLAAAVVFSL